MTAGVGLVWSTFMAAIGLLPLAALILVAAAIGAAWMLGARVPRVERARLFPSARTEAVALARRAAATGRSSRPLTRHAARAARRGTQAGARAACSTARGGAKAFRQAFDATRGATTNCLQSVKRTRPRLRRNGRDPRVDRALAWNSQGIAFAKAGLYAEAIDAFDSALALLAETGDRHHEGQVLANLGVVHRQVGGDEAARFCWTKALERLEPGTPESERTAELLGVR